MKRFIFIIISLFFVFSGIMAQKATEYSQFVDFEELGIQKAQFIDKFGKPTCKNMSYDNDQNKIEVFLYKEDVGKDKTTIITRLTFKNDKLIEQKSEIEVNQINKEMLDKISTDLTFIRHRVLMK